MQQNVYTDEKKQERMKMCVKYGLVKDTINLSVFNFSKIVVPRSINKMYRKIDSNLMSDKYSLYIAIKFKAQESKNKKKKI